MECGRGIGRVALMTEVPIRIGELPILTPGASRWCRGALEERNRGTDN